MASHELRGAKLQDSRVGLSGGTINHSDIHCLSDSIFIELRFDLNQADHSSDAFLQGSWDNLSQTGLFRFNSHPWRETKTYLPRGRRKEKAP